MAKPNADVQTELHRLVDSLPPHVAILAKRMLEVLIEESEYDNEPLSAEEQAALARGKQQAAGGETVSWKKVREEL